MLPVIYRRAAELELQEAFDWYEERRAGLGSEFILCVDACVELIRRHPGMFRTVHKNVRHAVIRRFPYSIFYLFENEKIVVLSVFHAAREPRRWS